MEAYLDNSATTRPCPECIATMQTALQSAWGNPSSLHGVGLHAEHQLQQARAQIAQSLQCQPQEVVFTSGGTESNNLALLGAAGAMRRRGNRIVTSPVEHSSVEETARALEQQGFELVQLHVDSHGRVCPDELTRCITPTTILVSLMAVNNELGTVQPIECIHRVVQAAGSPALIHCDAVQAYGKLALQPALWGVDLLSVSAHKIHGPKGAGALYVRKGVHLNPVLFGGGQEGKLRPGTEATPAIAGFAAAAAALPPIASTMEHVSALRERLVQGLAALPGTKINSPPDALPYLTNLSVPGLQSETLLNFLSERGISVSSGSACSKGKRSRVLRAMGLRDEDIAGALRVSFSRFSTEAEVDFFLAALQEAMQTLARKAS